MKPYKLLTKWENHRSGVIADPERQPAVATTTYARGPSAPSIKRIRKATAAPASFPRVSS